MRRIEEVQHPVLCTDPLLVCCLCKRLLRDAVQLSCLHSCCRHCFTTVATIDSSQGFACGSCGTVTQVGTEKPNYFIDCQVQKYASIAESRVCGVCKGNGEHDKAALVWCATCRHSLCGDCVAAHRQYFRQHVTQWLEELKSLGDVCGQPSVSSCPSHNKHLDVACVHCEQAKCIRCWAECKEKEHKIHIVGEKPFDTYVDNFVAIISTMERDVLQKSKVLDKPKSILQDTHAARDRHLGEIKMRKQCILDAVEMAYQEIEFFTKNAYDDLEAEGSAAAAVADRISSSLSDARNYIRRLVESNNKCEILNQQKAVRQRLSALSAEMDSLATTAKEVKLDASLPVDLDNVVRAWIGMPIIVSSASTSLSSAQPQQQQQRQHIIVSEREPCSDEPDSPEFSTECFSLATSTPVVHEPFSQSFFADLLHCSQALETSVKGNALSRPAADQHTPAISPSLALAEPASGRRSRRMKEKKKQRSAVIVKASADSTDVVEADVPYVNSFLRSCARAVKLPAPKLPVPSSGSSVQFKNSSMPDQSRSRPPSSLPFSVQPSVALYGTAQLWHASDSMRQLNYCDDN